MPSQSITDAFVDRRAERRQVGLPTSLHHTIYQVEVVVQDVSKCGFMAECDDAVAIGSHVALEVPGIGPVQAQVRWQLAGRMGGMFLDPISLTKCEWTAVRSQPVEVEA